MAEYISRSYVRKMAMLEMAYAMETETDSAVVLRMIDDAPAVDVVQVVHGRWEFLGPNRLVKECMCGTCSACKIRSKYITNIGLCPNCGARMDGARNGDEKD